MDIQIAFKFQKFHYYVSCKLKLINWDPSHEKKKGPIKTKVKKVSEAVKPVKYLKALCVSLLKVT